ncbi:hypothetical protein F4604DRAFT_1741261 [Suillus subluteus]|nr:hypothetical protein F4604DRAFT_1741261 [Suillus subluteus]
MSDPVRECLSSMTLCILFFVPHIILILASILGFQSYGYHVTFALGVLGTTVLIANLNYWFSVVSHYLDGPQNDWGCVFQLFNWVTVLVYLVSLVLFDAKISAFSVASMSIALILLFPVFEFPFWILVGSGRNKDHLHMYGEIHDWTAVKGGALLIVLATGPFELAEELAKVVGHVIITVRNLLNLLPRLPNQQLGTEQPPSYSGSTIHFWHRPINQIYKQSETHSVSSSAAKV